MSPLSPSVKRRECRLKRHGEFLESDTNQVAPVDVRFGYSASEVAPGSWLPL